MFFCPQKKEKNTSKSCMLIAVGRFFLCSPDCPKQPRTSFPFYKSFYSIVSPKVSEPTNMPKDACLIKICVCIKTFLGTCKYIPSISILKFRKMSKKKFVFEVLISMTWFFFKMRISMLECSIIHHSSSNSFQC